MTPAQLWAANVSMKDAIDYLSELLPFSVELHGGTYQGIAIVVSPFGSDLMLQHVTTEEVIHVKRFTDAPSNGAPIRHEPHEVVQ